MHDSGTKPPESRIHLFDPVGLLNDGYGYRASNYAVRPRRPTKSYDNFIDANTTTGGIRSYDSYSDANSVVGGLKSYDSFSSDTNVGGGFNSYDHTSSNNNKDINVGGGPKSYDHTNNNKDINGGGGGGLRFGVDATVEDDSDVSTPRLWKPSSPTSPKSLSVNSSPLHPAASPKSVKFTPPMSLNSSPVHPSHNHYHTISPNSRTQAIAKGRRELMEMVRDLPESFYELSLKDLVERKPDMEVQKEANLPEEKRPAVVKETTKTKETKKQQKKSSKKVKKSESKKKMMRSRSVDNGKFLLRTSVFPIFMGSKKNKKNLGGSSSSFKVAPVPKPPLTAGGSIKGVEKEWWRRKSCISSESEESNGLSSNSASSSSSTSTNTSRSNSGNGRRRNRFIPSCCFFNGRRIRGRK